MIKLVDLLENKKEEKYPPYMYSPVGFGCHVCEYYYMKDDKHYCNNELVDDEGNQIKDPSKWCSNWFHPKND